MKGSSDHVDSVTSTKTYELRLILEQKAPNVFATDEGPSKFSNPSNIFYDDLMHCVAFKLVQTTGVTTYVIHYNLRAT